ncbi:MAG: carbon monoxide dehydrogenase subunit G [Sphingobacteriales bacterium]|jgi:carbon monoxide dehydrogenase subunit G
MTIDSNPAVISKTKQEVFEFLNNLENHGQLMPPNIQDWKADQTTCSFKIQGMLELSLKKEETGSIDKIRTVPNGKAPVELDLEWNLTEVDGKTNAVFTINAKLNPFLKMMAQKPLVELANYQAAKLVDVMG